MSKIRLVPVFNCELPDGSRHALVVHYGGSYKPRGIGDAGSPHKESNQRCLNHPDGEVSTFKFSEDVSLVDTDFVGVRVICESTTCPHRKEIM